MSSVESSEQRALMITEFDTVSTHVKYKTIFDNYPVRADIEFETQRYQISDFIHNFDKFRQLNVEDLTGNRSILKLKETSIVTGASGPTLNEATNVIAIIHYALYSEHHPDSFDSTIARGKATIYRNGRLICGMEIGIGIGSMRSGEHCLLLIEPEYILSKTDSWPIHVPLKSPILADIYCFKFISTKELLQSLEFTDENINGALFNDMCEMGTRANETIKNYIEAGKIEEARNLSYHSIKILKRLHVANEFDNERLSVLLREFSVDLAKCQYWTQQYTECIKTCTKMFKYSKSNGDYETKMWCCMGHAYIAIKETEMAYESFKTAHFLSPDNKSIKTDMIRIDRILKYQQRRITQLATNN